MQRVLTIKGISNAFNAIDIEKAISKIDGVEYVSLNYTGQKFFIKIEDEKYKTVLNSMFIESQKIDPDCEIIVE